MGVNEAKSLDWVFAFAWTVGCRLCRVPFLFEGYFGQVFWFMAMVRMNRPRLVCRAVICVYESGAAAGIQNVGL